MAKTTNQDEFRRDVLLRAWDHHLVTLKPNPAPLADPRVLRPAPRPDAVVDLFDSRPAPDISRPLAIGGALTVIFCALAFAALVLWS
jgi:hypothetical protein